MVKPVSMLETSAKFEFLTNFTLHFKKKFNFPSLKYFFSTFSKSKVAIFGIFFSQKIDAKTLFFKISLRNFLWSKK